MYVSTCKGGATGQYTYVRLMESYRDENGKVKHKVVQNLGRLDILSQSDPNYLENLKKKYQEDYAEKNRLQSLNRLAQVQNLLSFDNNSSAGAPLPLLQLAHSSAFSPRGLFLQFQIRRDRRPSLPHRDHGHVPT